MNIDKRLIEQTTISGIFGSELVVNSIIDRLFRGLSKWCAFKPHIRSENDDYEIKFRKMELKDLKELEGVIGPYVEIIKLPNYTHISTKLGREEGEYSLDKGTKEYFTVEDSQEFSPDNKK